MLTSATVPLRISVAELAEGATSAPALDDGGGFVNPAIEVALDTPLSPTETARAADAARHCTPLLLGVRSDSPVDPTHRQVIDQLDLTLVPEARADDLPLVATADPERTAVRLHTAVEANPQAALVLKSVLRTTQHLTVEAALQVESFAYSTLLGGGEFARWLDGRGPRPQPDPALEPVTAERLGNRLRVVLNRPERRNAYGRQLRDALADALRVAILDDTIERVDLAGAGPSFCSGGDLDEFGLAPDLTTAHFVRTHAGAGGLLYELAERLHARIHGTCVGAGIELPAFAHHVSAHPQTTIVLPEIHMGLIPGAGGTVSIPRRIGRWRTMFLALSGDPLDATTARSWCLIDELVAEPH